MQKRFDILFRIVKEQRHAEILQGSPRMNSEIIMEQDYLEKKKFFIIKHLVPPMWLISPTKQIHKRMLSLSWIHYPLICLHFGNVSRTLLTILIVQSEIPRTFRKWSREAVAIRISRYLATPLTRTCCSALCLGRLTKLGVLWCKNCRVFILPITRLMSDNLKIASCCGKLPL